MGKTYSRTPLGYNGVKKTSHSLGEILPHFLSNLSVFAKERPDLMIAVWPQVVGSQIAQMTEVKGCVEGVLYVQVNNSTLLSLLAQRDKAKILRALRKKFPKTTLYDVVFRMR